LKNHYDSLEKSANKVLKENEILKARNLFLERHFVHNEDIPEEHENALQEFLKYDIKMSKLDSMIYSVSRNKGEGIDYSQLNNCEQSNHSICISKTPQGLYSTFVKSGSKDQEISTVYKILESEMTESSALITSEPETSKVNAQVKVILRAPAQTMSKPKIIRSTDTLVAGSSGSGRLIYSRAGSKNQSKNRTYF
jgi:hypothetical protein